MNRRTNPTIPTAYEISRRNYVRLMLCRNSWRWGATRRKGARARNKVVTAAKRAAMYSRELLGSARPPRRQIINREAESHPCLEDKHRNQFESAANQNLKSQQFDQNMLFPKQAAREDTPIPVPFTPTPSSPTNNSLSSLKS